MQPCDETYVYFSLFTEVELDYNDSTQSKEGAEQMTINELLNEVKQIQQKYEEQSRCTGACFNIFSIAHIEHDEITICRVLKELIDPKGSHYQGAVYLRLFLKHVLKLDEALYADVNLDKTVVEREKLIAGNRRIDIFIEIPGRISIPIEVKLYAGDQDAQCSDYYRYAKYFDGEPVMYYLTLDGHRPSPASMGNLPAKSVRTISFGSEILDWLSECLRAPETIRLAPIREIIMQLMDTLRKLTNQMEDKMETEIINLLLQSKENMKNADLIAEAAGKASQKILDQYFREISKRIEEKYPWLEKSFELDDFEEEEYAPTGIWYRAKHLADGKHSIALNVTYDQWIYAGFDVLDSDDNQIQYTKHFSQEELVGGNWKKNEYWPAWKYICEDKNSRPNFNYHNEAFYELLETDSFEKFVDETMRVVDELMESLFENSALEIN